MLLVPLGWLKILRDSFLASQEMETSSAATSRRQQPDGLRREAERIVAQRPPAPTSATVDDPVRLLHELHVLQVELELHRAELRTARVDLERARSRYHELYDGAPVGYLTLSKRGQIREINPAASAILGAPGRSVLGRYLSSFVAGHHQPLFRDHRRDALLASEPCCCELKLESLAGRSERWIQLRSSAVGASGSPPVELRTTLIDVTANLRAERALREINEGLERVVADRTAAAARLAGQLRSLCRSGVEERERRRVAREDAGEPGHQRIHVLLADDHPVLRQGLAELLTIEPDMIVVGQAADGRDAVELARELRPDVIVMDVAMPNLNGVDATRILARDQPEVKVIGLSMHERREMSRAMLEAGATIYLSKDGPLDELVRAIRSAGGRPVTAA
jgi:PAS domain S-box-containing protein